MDLEIADKIKSRIPTNCYEPLQEKIYQILNKQEEVKVKEDDKPKAKEEVKPTEQKDDGKKKRKRRGFRKDEEVPIEE